MLHLLLTIIVKCSISIPDNTGRTHSNLNLASKLVRQLIVVERFRTTFHLTLHGNENLCLAITNHGSHVCFIEQKNSIFNEYNMWAEELTIDWIQTSLEELTNP